MKINEPNLRKWQKIKLILDQTWSPKFFSWVLPLADVMHCCKL